MRRGKGEKEASSLFQVFEAAEGLDLEETVSVFRSTHYVASAVRKWALSQGGAERKIVVTEK